MTWLPIIPDNGPVEPAVDTMEVANCYYLSRAMDKLANGKSARRASLTKDLQVRVFRRDCWICRWCGRPVIFAPAMKYLEQFVRRAGFTGPLAYHDVRWRRDKSPLLDHLGAVIDHVQAHSRGGAADQSNFVTSCNKCNTRKSAMLAADFSKRAPFHPVKGKYGEPQDWDGLSTLFAIMVEQASQSASQSELDWLRALRANGPGQI